MIRSRGQAEASPSLLRRLFLLDPEVVFLNHGSFGACPRPVFDEYQRWQRELERRPVEFLARRYAGLIDEAKARLAAYLGAGPDDLAFVPNATAGMNVVARSLELAHGDEVLVTTHGYGAVDFLWAHVCARAGATLVRREIEPGPGVVDELWAAVTPRTRVISISHIRPRPRCAFRSRRSAVEHARGGDPGRRRRRPCTRADRRRSRSARRRLLLGQLSQMAVRAQGRGLSLGAAGASAGDGATRPRVE